MTDYSVALAIVMDPVIDKNIYEDGAMPLIPDLVHECWVGIRNTKDILGCYRLHPTGKVQWQIHAFLLPQFRKEYSLDATRMVLKWAVANIENLEKLICMIPDAHPNIVAHAKKTGFNFEGKMEQSFLFNGEIMGQEIWGITKDTIEKL